jgi:hypothetical protein
MGLRSWPPVARHRWGLGIDFSAGTGLPVEAPQFHGAWTDVAVSPTLRFRWRPAPQVSIEPSVGVSGHFTWIAGALAAGGNARTFVRFDGAADAGLGLGWVAASRVDLGVACNLSWWFRYQVFVVNEVDRVLSLSPVTVDGSALVRLRLD